MSRRRFSNEDNFTSSDSDEFREFFQSCSSLDRSSVGSIPWAEDAIKQNQQEWERVERMFYGEEKLPDDLSLKNEILEWNQFFPHIRIKGEKIVKTKSLHVKGRPISPVDIKDENFTDNHTRGLMKFSARSFEQDRNNIKTINQYLEKDLRISSVPMISKRVHYFPKLSSNLILRPSEQLSMRSSYIHEVIPSNSSGSLLMQKNNLIPVEKPSNSARIIRMPPIIIVPSEIQQKQVSAHVNRKQKTTVVLPSINLNNVKYVLKDVAQSKSVLNHKAQSSLLPVDASKLKLLK